MPEGCRRSGSREPERAPIHPDKLGLAAHSADGSEPDHGEPKTDSCRSWSLGRFRPTLLDGSASALAELDPDVDPALVADVASWINALAS